MFHSLNFLPNEAKANFYPFFTLIILSLSCSKKLSYPIELPKQNLAIDIITLSSDEMEGREIGTIGERKAGEYIANRFDEIGLDPAGDGNTYFQTFTCKKSGNPHGDETTTTGLNVTGRNVLGFINNNAPSTVIVGGHYDHLGYGEEGSLHAGDPAIHNGADDNSSGVAGVLYLAESIKNLILKTQLSFYLFFRRRKRSMGLQLFCQ